MDETRIAIIGDKDGIRNVYNSIRYPQLIGAAYEYNNEMIEKAECDFLDGWEIIVVALSNRALADSIKAIINRYRSNSAVVLDFYILRQVSRPRLVADIVMNNPYYENYEGLILGMSHAEVGIIPGRLQLGNVANLAVPSQDLYYNLKTLEYCLSNYPEKISGIRNVIIDMYDYSYFNFDSSMVAKFMNFLGCGGYDKDKHNYDKNKQFLGHPYDELVDSIRGFWKLDNDDEIIEIWNMLFDTSLGKMYEDRYMNINDIADRVGIVSDQQLEEFSIGRYAHKRFEETIKENRLCLEKILELLYNLNPEMNIYMVLIPRYEGVWEKESILFNDWKEDFYNILDEVSNRYRF